MAVIGNAINNITAYMNTVPTKDQALVYTATATGGVWLDSVNKTFKYGNDEYEFNGIKVTDRVDIANYSLQDIEGNLYLKYASNDILYYSINSNKIVLKKPLSASDITTENLKSLWISASGSGTLRIENPQITSPVIDGAKFSGVTDFRDNTVKKAVITESQFSGNIVGGSTSSSTKVQLQNYIKNLGTIVGGDYLNPELYKPILWQRDNSLSNEKNPAVVKDVEDAKSTLRSEIASSLQEAKDYHDTQASQHLDSISARYVQSNGHLIIDFTRADGTTGSASVDLPLESALVHGTYNNTTKKITFTMAGGNKLEVHLLI